MSKVFFSIALSLYGYMVPRDMDLLHADNITEQPWFRQWSAPHSTVPASGSRR